MLRYFRIKLFPNITTLFYRSQLSLGWGSRYPGHGILTPTLYSWQIVWNKKCSYMSKKNNLPRQFEKGKYLRNIYFAKLLWFYNCSIEDFKTSEARLGGGQDTQATVSWPPPCIPDTLCYYLPRPFEKGKYLRNNYHAKLHWFYNYSSEDFRTSEAQVWVGVKIPRPRYLDPHPVFLTHCVISYQDRLENANI